MFKFYAQKIGAFENEIFACPQKFKAFENRRFSVRQKSMIFDRIFEGFFGIEGNVIS